MPLVKKGLNEAERGVLTIMTVIMEELSAPRGGGRVGWGGGVLAVSMR